MAGVANKISILLGFFAAAFLLGGAGYAGAASVEPSVAIRSMQNLYGGMDSFQAEFTQELTHQESGSVETRSGTFQFAKPMLVRWETKAPHPELLLATDKEIWNYLPDEKLAYRYSLELVQDSRSIIVVLTGQSALDQEFDVEPMDDEDGMIHLLLYPKDPAPQMTEAHVWLDPRSFLIRRAMVMDFYGNTNLVTFTSMKPGGKTDPAQFRFTPPAGVEVEDHTDSGLSVEIPLPN